MLATLVVLRRLGQVGDVTLAGQVRGTMPETEMKAQLSISYFGAIAATAGVATTPWNVDYDGVDGTVRSYAVYPATTGAALDVQLKCTSDASHLGTDSASWSLKEKVYNGLSVQDRYYPAILAILVLPGSYETWLHQDEERLLARGCMYYSWAPDWKPLADGAESGMVHCSRKNIFHVDSLLSLLTDAAALRGGSSNA